MKAIAQQRYGAPQEVLKLVEMERPTVGNDDVLIEVLATSVNTPDWITVTGVPYVLRLRFGLWRPPTPTRGTDVAGIVAAVGRNVTEFRPGDAVFGSGWAESLATRAGTFAEYTVCPASQLVKKPDAVRFEEAAASVMSGLTALNAMRDVGKVTHGSKVLINGASGGVGTFAVQIARALGAEVTGVCSTRNVDLVRSLGATHAIDYTRLDFTRVRSRFDVILDNVVNRKPSETVRVLAPGGVFIPNSIGNDGGLFAGLPRMGRAALMGKGSTNVRFATCEVTRENLETLAWLLACGKVRSVIDSVHRLDDAAVAVERMLGHHAVGNVVIAV